MTAIKFQAFFTTLLPGSLEKLKSCSRMLKIVTNGSEVEMVKNPIKSWSPLSNIGTNGGIHDTIRLRQNVTIFNTTKCNYDKMQQRQNTTTTK